MDERQLLDLPASEQIQQLTIVAPGRICLFGDHQDYLGLPVIACAIDKQLVLSAEKNATESFHILMPDIASEKIIPISESFQYLEPQDYFASALRVARKNGCIPSVGYNILIKSDIPINAGVSSSSAVVVAFVHFLLKAFGCHQPISSELIAKLAYEAEVIEHNSPGGKMDQYTIAIGNILYINTASEGSFKTIGSSLPGLILAESGIPKETLGLLSELRTKATKAIELVSKKIPNFNLKVTTLERLGPYSENLPNELKPYFYAAIRNHLITKAALKEFEKSPMNLQKIGSLMSEHHLILKNELKITVPRIDAMITAALDAGAYGAKIVGSGGGGSIVALAPSDKLPQIIKAIRKSGAKAVYKVSVTRGTHIE